MQQWKWTDYNYMQQCRWISRHNVEQRKPDKKIILYNSIHKIQNQAKLIYAIKSQGSGNPCAGRETVAGREHGGVF